MADLSEILPRALVPFAVFSAFAVARRYWPVSAEQDREYDVDLLDEEFKYQQWVVALGMCAAGSALALGSYWFLSTVNGAFARAEGDVRFVLLPDKAIWWIFSMLLGITASWDAVLLAWSAISGRRQADKYLFWSHVKAGFNATKFLRGLLVFVCAPIGGLTLLATPMHTTFHDDGVRIHEYAAIRSAHYSYADVKRMAFVSGFRDRIGAIVRRPAIVLDFKDGRRWSSGENRDFKAGIDMNLAAYLVGHTGLHFELAEAESDLK